LKHLLHNRTAGYEAKKILLADDSGFAANNSIHMEVSTKSFAAAPALTVLRPAFPHSGKVSLPDSRSKEMWNALDLPHANYLFQGNVDGGGIGLGCQNLGGLGEQILIQDKLCALHVHQVTTLNAQERCIPPTAFAQWNLMAK